MQVFFSYAREDSKFAMELAKRVSRAGYEVWSADEELYPGDNWPLKIGRALEDSGAMVVLLSPHAVKSSWVRREIDYALTSENYAGRLVPVVVRPTREIPWILERFQVIKAGKDLAETARQVVKALKGSKLLEVAVS